MSKILNKFNIVDVVLMLLVAVVIIGGIWFLTRDSGGEARYVYFTVEMRSMEEHFAEIPEIGGVVRCAIRNHFLGYVYDVRVEPFYIISFNPLEGIFFRDTVPERYDVFITVRGNGTETDLAIHSEGELIRIGREMSIGGRGFAHTGFVVYLRTEPRGGV